ncbi:MAG: hypothetical protein IIX68_01595 [Clostridia bacterium]|nr:hypothetical protein [Clostridia bacterium]
MTKTNRLLLVAAALLLIVAVVLFSFGTQRREQQILQQAIQDYREAKLAQYRAENDRYADYEVEVAFLGDSLTDGYDLTKYYPQYVTANRGIGGDTTFDLEARLAVSVYELKPQVAVMLIGANNPYTMMENYEAILSGLKTNLPNTQVVLLSMTAMGGEIWGPKNPQAMQNNIIIQSLAKKYDFTYVDLFTPLYDLSAGEVYAGYTVDGGHFTHEGYLAVTAQITPVLEQLLGK